MSVPRPKPAGPRRQARTAGLVFTAIVLGGCATPRVAARPLEPRRVLREVTAARRRAPVADGLTLGEAVALLRRHNPEVRRARAAWQRACAVARTPTPLPNPELEVGPLLIGGSDVLSSGTWGLEALLGWTVLLADTRSLTDDVNAVRAGAAFAAAAAVEREQYLALRREVLAAVTAAELLEVRRLLASTAERARAMADEAVEAGSATTLDAQLLALEASSVTAEAMEGEEAATEARGQLGARLGVDTTRIAVTAADRLPPLPAELPSRSALEALVLRDHPALAVRRADYLVLEKELRLEVARQWPQLDIGLGVEDEGEETKLGLPLGIELPIFDRNQPAIAEARAARDEAREGFAAELTDVLAEVEMARARVEGRWRRLALLAERAGQAKRLADAAAAVLDQAGTFDMLRYLEVLRTTRGVRIEYLEARAALYDAWADLEEACGAPLLRFPDEPGSPSAPEKGDG